MTPRQHDGVRRGSRGSDQDVGGAGPGLCSDGERPRYARIFRITAGSRSVAINRSRRRSCAKDGRHLM
jgi:hypothetical protein